VVRDLLRKVGLLERPPPPGESVPPAGDATCPLDSEPPQFIRRLRSLSFYPTLFYVYLGVALLAFTFLVPPFQKSDEPAHFHRSVSLTNLDFFCEKDEEGEYYFEMKRKYGDLPEILRVWDVAFDYESKFRTEWLRADFSDPSLQEPVRIYRFCSLPIPGYLPNSLGVLVGKPFENPLVSFYLARLFGAAFFVGAVVLSLRIVPDRYKLLIYFYAAIPTVLHQVSAVSYDAVQLSLFPLMLAYLTRFAEDRQQIKPAHLLIFLGLLWWMLNVRLFAYYPLVLLYFLIHPRMIADTFSRYLRVTGAFLGATTVTTGAFALAYLPRATDSGPGEVDIDAREQVRLVLENPRGFLDASYNTLRLYGEGLLRETIGVFGWIDYTFTYIPYYAAILATGFVIYHVASKDTPLFRPWQLGALLLAIFSTAAFLFLSLYAVWSPVGFELVWGLQGRYFLGLFPFTILLVSQAAALVGKERLLQAGVLVVAAFFAYSIVREILFRYY
jgi:uncharacterized membrane protein